MQGWVEKAGYKTGRIGWTKGRLSSCLYCGDSLLAVPCFPRLLQTVLHSAARKISLKSESSSQSPPRAPHSTQSGSQVLQDTSGSTHPPILTHALLLHQPWSPDSSQTVTHIASLGPLHLLLPPPGMFSCPSSGLTPMRFLLRHYFAGEGWWFLSILFPLLCLTIFPTLFTWWEFIFS